MNMKGLLSRIRELEKEAPLLIGKILDFLITKWVLVAFLGAIILWLFVRVGPMEGIVSEYEKKKLSQFYCNLGDRFMNISEWEAAEEAYKQATILSPHNENACYGILRAQVFAPPHGKKYHVEEVVDAKIASLFCLSGSTFRLTEESLHVLDSAKIPKQIANRLMGINEEQFEDEKTFRKALTAEIGEVAASTYDSLITRHCLYSDDHQAHFLRGWRYYNQRQYDDAVLEFKKSVTVKTDFIGGYFGLGYVFYDLGKVDSAICFNRKVLDIDTSYSLAWNNLGGCYFDKYDYQASESCFVRSYLSAPTALTGKNIAEALVYLKQYSKAKAWLKLTLENVQDSSLAEERYVSGVWTPGYDRLTEQDTITPRKEKIKLADYHHKVIFIRYSLSFALALLREIDDADKVFDVCLRSDQREFLRDYVAHKMISIQNLLKPEDRVKRWFKEKLIQLLETADYSCLDRLAEGLNRERLYHVSEQLLQYAVETRERKLGSDHPYVANSLNQLAFSLSSQGRFLQAIQLAHSLRLQVNCDLADSLCRRALEVLERQHGPDRPDAAEDDLRSALEVLKKRRGANDPDVTSILYILAASSSQATR